MDQDDDARQRGGGGGDVPVILISPSSPNGTQQSPPLVPPSTTMMTSPRLPGSLNLGDSPPPPNYSRRGETTTTRDDDSSPLVAEPPPPPPKSPSRSFFASLVSTATGSGVKPTTTTVQGGGAGGVTGGGGFAHSISRGIESLSLSLLLLPSKLSSSSINNDAVRTNKGGGGREASAADTARGRLSLPRGGIELIKVSSSSEDEEEEEDDEDEEGERSSDQLDSQSEEETGSELDDDDDEEEEDEHSLLDEGEDGVPQGFVPITHVSTTAGGEPAELTRQSMDLRLEQAVTGPDSVPAVQRDQDAYFAGNDSDRAAGDGEGGVFYHDDPRRPTGGGDILGLGRVRSESPTRIQDDDDDDHEGGTRASCIPERGGASGSPFVPSSTATMIGFERKEREDSQSTIKNNPSSSETAGRGGGGGETPAFVTLGAPRSISMIGHGPPPPLVRPSPKAAAPTSLSSLGQGKRSVSTLSSKSMTRSKTSQFFSKFRIGNNNNNKNKDQQQQQPREHEMSSSSTTAAAARPDETATTTTTTSSSSRIGSSKDLVKDGGAVRRSGSLLRPNKDKSKSSSSSSPRREPGDAGRGDSSQQVGGGLPSSHSHSNGSERPRSGSGGGGGGKVRHPKVRRKGKPKKDFNHLFLAQELDLVTMTTTTMTKPRVPCESTRSRSLPHDDDGNDDDDHREDTNDTDKEANCDDARQPQQRNQRIDRDDLANESSVPAPMMTTATAAAAATTTTPKAPPAGCPISIAAGAATTTTTQGGDLGDGGGDEGATSRKQRRAVWAMKFSNNGKWLAVGGRDGVVRVWEVLSTRKERDELFEKHESSLTGVMPVFKDKPIREYRGHSSDVLDLNWSKNDFLLSSSMDKTVRLWHIDREECLCSFEHLDFVTSIAFHPKDDRFFLSGSLDCKLRLWNIVEKRVQVWTELPELITAVAFTRDGQYAIAGSFVGQCMFFEVETFRFHNAFTAKSSKRKEQQKGKKITSLVTFPLAAATARSNSPTLATFTSRDGESSQTGSEGDEGGQNRTSRTRRTRRRRSTASSRRSITGIDDEGEADEEEDFDRLLVTSNDSHMRLYNTKGRFVEAKYSGHENTSSQIRASFSDDGKYVICGSEDRHVYIWDSRIERNLFGDLEVTKKRSEGAGYETFSMAAHIVTAAVFTPTATRNLLARSGDPIFSNSERYPHLDPFPRSESTRSASRSDAPPPPPGRTRVRAPSRGGGKHKKDSSNSMSGSPAQDMIIVVADAETGIISVFRNSEIPAALPASPTTTGVDSSTYSSGRGNGGGGGGGGGSGANYQHQHQHFGSSSSSTSVSGAAAAVVTAGHQSKRWSRASSTATH